jgi:predicted kinase
VISGLPGSGKSTLARCLVPLLDIPVIDKDDFLERLFESQGPGDAPRRRRPTSDCVHAGRIREMATTRPNGMLGLGDDPLGARSAVGAFSVNLILNGPA